MLWSPLAPPLLIVPLLLALPSCDATNNTGKHALLGEIGR